MLGQPPVGHPALGLQRLRQGPGRNRLARFHDGQKLLQAPGRIHQQAVQRPRIGMTRVQQERSQRKSDAVVPLHFAQVQNPRRHRARIVLPVIPVGKRERRRRRIHAGLELPDHPFMLGADPLGEFLRRFQPLLGFDPQRGREKIAGFAVRPRRNPLEAAEGLRADLPGARSGHVAQNGPAQGRRILLANGVGPDEHDRLPAVRPQDRARLQIGILAGLLHGDQDGLARKRHAVEIEIPHVREPDGIEPPFAQRPDLLLELRAGHFVRRAHRAGADPGIGQRDEGVRIAHPLDGRLVAHALIDRPQRHPQRHHQRQARQKIQPGPQIAVLLHRLGAGPARRQQRRRGQGRRPGCFRVRRFVRRCVRLGQRGGRRHRDGPGRRRGIIRRPRLRFRRPGLAGLPMVGFFLHPRVPHFRPRRVARAQYTCQLKNAMYVKVYTNPAHQ